MSSQIRQERDAYYEILERTQRGTLDVTDWLEWFLASFFRATVRAQERLRGVLYKARFWERHGTRSLNQRQVKVLNRLLEGFEGKLTTSKWAARGRSTSYSLTDV